ncbi:MAG: hypothetical protein AAGE65_11995 [Planctomycetota bacterium]
MRFAHRFRVRPAVALDIWVLAAAGLLWGCEADPPSDSAGLEPTVSVVSAEDFRLAFARAQEAAGLLTAVRSPVRVEIRDASGRVVRLEGAFAARDPDDVRLKLWRHGRDVMDLTRVSGHGYVWLEKRVAERLGGGDWEGSAPGAGGSDRLTGWLSAMAWFIEPDEPEPGDRSIGFDSIFPGFDRLGASVPGRVETRPIEEERFVYDARTGLVLTRRPATGGAWRADFAYTSDTQAPAAPPRRTGMTLAVGDAVVRITLTDPTWNELLGDELFKPSARARPLDGSGPR